MTPKLLSAKYDNEEVVITMDFSPSLATGETLTGTPTVSVTTNSGTDATPGDILNGAPTILGGNQVRVPVKGGVKNCSYLIKAVSDTSNADKRLEIVAILPINPQ